MISSKNLHKHSKYVLGVAKKFNEEVKYIYDVFFNKNTSAHDFLDYYTLIDCLSNEKLDCINKNGFISYYNKFERFDKNLHSNGIFDPLIKRTTFLKNKFFSLKSIIASAISTLAITHAITQNNISQLGNFKDILAFGAIAGSLIIPHFIQNYFNGIPNDNIKSAISLNEQTKNLFSDCIEEINDYLITYKIKLDYNKKNNDGDMALYEEYKHLIIDAYTARNLSDEKLMRMKHINDKLVNKMLYNEFNLPLISSPNFLNSSIIYSSGMQFLQKK